MGDKVHIDELLKESLSNFTPEAPDVWSGISQQLGNSAVQTSLAGKVATFVKSATLTTKIAIIAGLPVLGGIGLVVYQSLSPTKNEPIILVENKQPITEKMDVNAIPPVITEEVIEKSKEKPAPQKSKVGTKPDHKAIQENQNNLQPVENEKDNEQLSTPPVTLSVSNNQTATKALPTVKPVQKQTRPTMYDRSERSGNKDVQPVTSPSDAYNKVVIPNVFTPDGSGENDVFRISIEEETYFFLRIFDLNGNMVFESMSKDTYWDGKNIAGNPCEDGVYTYLFVYELKDGNRSNKSGTIKLIR